MFNRKLEVRLVKDTKPTETPETEKPQPYDYAAETRKVVKQVVIGSVVIIAASVVLHTLAAVTIAALEANLED